MIFLLINHLKIKIKELEFEFFKIIFLLNNLILTNYVKPPAIFLNPDWAWKIKLTKILLDIIPTTPPPPTSSGKYLKSPLSTILE